MERSQIKGASGDAITVILAAAGRICQTGSISPPSTTNANPAGPPTASTQGPRAVLNWRRLCARCERALKAWTDSGGTSPAGRLDIRLASPGHPKTISTVPC